MDSKNFRYLLYICFFIFIFSGGLGWKDWGQVIIHFAACLIFLVFIIWQYLLKKQLSLPKGLYLYLLFLFFFALSFFWTSDFFYSGMFFMLFLSGGMVWVIFYNLHFDIKKFNILLLIYGIFFAGLTYYNFRNLSPLNVSSYGLVNNSVIDGRHYHLGDFWAILASISIANLIDPKKSKLFWGLSLILGLVILFLSESRSSYVALAAGAAYLFREKLLSQKWKPFIYLTFALILVIFISVSAGKEVFLTRQYFLKSIWGFLKYPAGVGVGNFRVISAQTINFLPHLNSVASIAHNFFLEFISGLGVFGVIFICWYVRIIVDLYTKKSNTNYLPKMIFLVLSVNFFFDYTYFIPTMLWLWFISLALAQTPVLKRYE